MNAVRMSDSITELAPDLLAAKADLKPVGKGGENKYDRYSYAREVDWYASINPVLNRHHLGVVFSCGQLAPTASRQTKGGGSEHHCYVHGCARLIHKSGQWIEVDGIGEGQDRADKGVYKAQTGLRKYLYALLLSLPTTDDPESDETVGRPAAPEVSFDKLNALKVKYAKAHKADLEGLGQTAQQAEFQAWAKGVVGEDVNYLQPGSWRQDSYMACCKDLGGVSADVPFEG